MEKRKCRYCKKEYSIEEFEIANIIKGKEYRRWKCKECYNIQKNKRRNEIKKWFIDFKKTLKCEECEEDDFRVLDFHHKNREEKDFMIGDVIKRGYSEKTIMKEVEKCKVLCCKCHRILHWEEKENLERR